MADTEVVRRTRIVATIGPASRSAEAIDALLTAGMNVARLNCAHGDHAALGAMVTTLRARAAAHSRPLAILADLGGPKLRVGRFADGGVELVKDAPFVLTTEPVLGNAQRASVNYAHLAADVQPGDVVYLNDGLIRLRITGVAGGEVQTQVEIGGPLGDLKGLSVPAAEIRTPSMTDKDWDDLEFLIGAGIDYVGLSFVRAASDVADLRAGLNARGATIPIVAKIEKAQAVTNLAAIVAEADAVMVARGDLGVECPIAEVATLQKRIIRCCNEAGKPVITATQMLESMVANPRPTRAEVTDVANAVLDGSDAVMLSAETATGHHPVAAVEMMDAIVRHSEAYATTEPSASARGPKLSAKMEIARAVARGACAAADSVAADAIVCLTQSGATARALAACRPHHPIVAVTADPSVYRQLSLVWGCRPVLVDGFDLDFDRATRRILAALRQQHGLHAGSTVIVTAGLPFAVHPRTNTLRVEVVGD